MSEDSEDGKKGGTNKSHSNWFHGLTTFSLVIAILVGIPSVLDGWANMFTQSGGDKGMQIEDSKLQKPALTRLDILAEKNRFALPDKDTLYILKQFFNFVSTEHDVGTMRGLKSYLQLQVENVGDIPASDVAIYTSRSIIAEVERDSGEIETRAIGGGKIEIGEVSPQEKVRVEIWGDFTGTNELEIRFQSGTRAYEQMFALGGAIK